MPRRPFKPCAVHGCAVLVEGAERCCTKHQKLRQQQDSERRGSAHERGYTSAWTRARTHYLRAHPLCAHCAREGVVTAATVVDHITPPRLRDALDSGDAGLIARAKALFWDSLRNWQSLCKRHHDIKTATEDGGFGRKAGH